METERQQTDSEPAENFSSHITTSLKNPFGSPVPKALISASLAGVLGPLPSLQCGKALPQSTWTLPFLKFQLRLYLLPGVVFLLFST